MSHPLLYLTVHSIRNRVRVRLQRLKQPRYLIASVLGVAYFGFFFIGTPARRGGVGILHALVREQAIAELALMAFLFLTIALAWFWPGSRRPALNFSRAEVTHLFTAPIPRRRLVRYRMLRSQLGALFASAIMTIILRPSSLWEALIAVVGITTFIAAMTLHTTGVSLFRANRGTRTSVTRAVAALAFVIVIGTFASQWAALTAAFANGNAVAEISRITTTGLAGVVLWPLRAVARLPLSVAPAAFLAALPGALAVLVLNYFWVLRTDAPFEEASAELSEKMDKVRRQGMSALRPPRVAKRTPFTLSPQGRPEAAILWKNLIAMSRVFSWTTLLRFVPLLILVAIAMSRRRSGAEGFLAFVCLFAAGFTLFLGSHMMRRDLRQDIHALAVLKTWPVRGAALVRGEILAPAIVLTIIASLALTGAAILSSGTPLAERFTNPWMWLAASLLVVPGIVLAQVLAQNAMAVTFPAWVAITPAQGGVDVMGQRLLVMLAVVFGLIVALIPAAIVGGIGGGILYLLIGVVWPIVPAALGGATLLVEVFIGTEVVGAILDRTDISAVDAAES